MSGCAVTEVEIEGVLLFSSLTYVVSTGSYRASLARTPARPFGVHSEEKNFTPRPEKKIGP